MKVKSKLRDTANNYLKHTKKQKGITLIALVITIIILLILAGIVIAALTGENGLITRAIEAKNETEKGTQDEEIKLSKLELLMNSEMNQITLSNGNILYKDKNNDFAIIPKGFVVSGYENERTVENGLVIYQVDNNENVEWTEDKKQSIQETYNQFVWVPVEFDEYFKTYDGYRNGKHQSVILDCQEPCVEGYPDEEIEYSQMKESVLEYDGFYIGRYEAGIDSASERTENSNIDENAVIKKGKYVYNFIGWSNSNDMNVENGGAVEKSKNFDTENGYTSVISTLIYGVQWDAVMQWFDKKYIAGSDNLKSIVSDSTGKGNYYDSENQNEWKGRLAKTGSSTDYEIKNIYDLAGNAREWTMESYGSNLRIRRGGYYNNSGFDGPVSDRAFGNPMGEFYFNSFRICLYIK